MTDDGLRSIPSSKRNCYFPDEAHHMKLHKNYSQANCVLECSLKYAQLNQSNKTGLPVCTPWYFPFNHEGHKICDPWETVELSTIIADQV